MRSALIIFFALLSGCSRHSADGPRPAIVVSVADLADHGARFNGKRVRVAGLWATRMEESRLLPLNRDEKKADIWLEFSTEIQKRDPQARAKIMEALRDFDEQRNYYRFYYVRIECEGLFMWKNDGQFTRQSGYGHLGGSRSQLLVDHVVEAKCAE